MAKMKTSESLHKKYGNLFTSLEIESDKQTFTSKKLKRAYRKLALKYHPDKNSSSEATAIFVKIKEIYQYLLVAKNRTEYFGYLGMLEARKQEMREKGKEKVDFARKLLEREAKANLEAREKVRLWLL